MKKIFLATLMMVATMGAFANNDAMTVNSNEQNAVATRHMVDNNEYNQLALMAKIATYSITNYHEALDDQDLHNDINLVNQITKSLKEHDAASLRHAIDQANKNYPASMKEGIRDYQMGIFKANK